MVNNTNIVVDVGVKMLVRCLYGSGLPACPSGAKDAEKAAKLEAQTEPTEPKITEPTRQAALKLPLAPVVIKDSETASS